MSNKEFAEKLKVGIELAGKRMLEEKARRGEDLIVSSDGKNIKRIPAQQFIKESQIVL
ncbi:MAG: histidine kinase [Prevotella sp.]|nr:histidine kinase [Prevotella sp.]